MSRKSLTDGSRASWLCNDEAPTDAEIQTGCLQRIADAAELMAKNHAELVEERDRLKSWNDQKRVRIEYQSRRIAGLIGYIGRLKRQLSEQIGRATK